jgi:uncharacterized protein DUF5678
VSEEVVFHPNTEVIWIQKNQDYLWEHHAGQWIAVVGEKLVAFGDDPADVWAEAREKGYPKALVTGVRRREYQNVRMIL